MHVYEPLRTAAGLRASIRSSAVAPTCPPSLACPAMQHAHCAGSLWQSNMHATTIAVAAGSARCGPAHPRPLRATVACPGLKVREDDGMSSQAAAWWLAQGRDCGLHCQHRRAQVGAT